VIVPRRLRTPGGDGAILAEPPFSETGALIRANRKTFSQFHTPLLGRSWPGLQSQARQIVVARARDYLRHASEPVPDYGDESLIMAGHQPELVHPGVWVKHFALTGLARKHGSTPVNLVVDNDTAKACAIRLPLVSGARGTHSVSVPFDQWAGEVPFEERTVKDEALFATFAQRAAPLVGNWNFRPLLFEFWNAVLRQVARTSLLGERLAAARRAFERQWGCHNLEIPVSLLCASEPFAWFTCHVLCDLKRFHATYNACVHEYRRQYGVRSRNHPVPDLAVEGDWYELPFWTWRTGQLTRRRLMARPTATAIELHSGDEPLPALPLASEAGAEAMVRAFQELERGGFKVRSRALTNTLFARLFLADLFVHGIGGAKYDELTDELIRRFFGFDPPGYMVLSATLRLPVPAFPATSEEHRRYAARLRDFSYNPQRHLPEKTLGDPRIRELIEQRQSWVMRQPQAALERKERFIKLRGLTAQLNGYVSQEVERFRQELTRSETELQANAVLKRRDYVFCLFPETVLRPFCNQFLSMEDL
jgi:hypothetical protein